jgi:hypothetical protein
MDSDPYIPRSINLMTIDYIGFETLCHSMIRFGS